MRKIIAAGFATSLLFLFLAGSQIAYSQETETQETETEEMQTPETEEPETEMQLRAAVSDLTIIDVSQAGNTDQVKIQNLGSVASKPARLYGYRTPNNAINWIRNGTAGVPAIQPGGQISVNLPGAAASPRLYFVDAINQVTESNEDNNFAYKP